MERLQGAMLAAALRTWPRPHYLRTFRGIGTVILTAIEVAILVNAVIWLFSR